VQKKSIRQNNSLGGRPNKDIRHDKADPNKEFTEIQPDSEQEQGETTDDIREAIREVLIHNTPMLKGWLEEVGKDNPGRALSIFKDLTEFCVPRLQRSDSKLDTSSPVQVIFESIEGFEKRKEEKEQKKAEAKMHTEQSPLKIVKDDLL